MHKFIGLVYARLTKQEELLRHKAKGSLVARKPGMSNTYSSFKYLKNFPIDYLVLILS